MAELLRKRLKGSSLSPWITLNELIQFSQNLSSCKHYCLDALVLDAHNEISQSESLLHHTVTVGGTQQC